MPLRAADARDVAFGPAKRGPRDVDADDSRGSMCEGDDREAPGVREQVQHALARGELSDPSPIFALVEKQTRAQALVKPSLERNAVLVNDQRFGRGSS